MIAKHCFTKEWLSKIKLDFPAIDPTILEKTIYAFELLSLLVQEEIDFVFKGGTSLLILLPQPKRLSIDVDILTAIKPETLEIKFNSIIKKEIFFEWSEDPRTESKIPKKHYKFFFNSVVNPTFKSSVLLDILFQENPYPKTDSKPVKSQFFETTSDVKILVPTVNSILGDKLIAFAPTTTGIHFGINKEMQINKQLFDIGELFNHSDDINEIEDSFNRFVEIESVYRDEKFSTESVIKDLFEISFLISQIKIRGGKENAITNEFVFGMRELRSHLISGTYNLEHTKINAAKTACVVSLFGKEVDIKRIREYNADKINDVKLSNDLSILERLKTLLPESYYYWQLIQRNFI